MSRKDKAAALLPEGSVAGIHSPRSGRVRGRAPLRWTDYVFCLVVGSIFLFALTRTIFSATVISIDSISLYTISLVSIVFFMIATYNLVTRLTALTGAIVFGLYTLNAVFRNPPYRPDGETFPRVIEHFRQLLLMAGGAIPYEYSLGRTAIWLVSMAFGLVIVIFILHIFSFYVLVLMGIAVFAFTWAPGFLRDEGAFLIFLFAICAILIRKMNRSASATLVVVPLCALVVFFSQRNMPTESDAFVRRPLTQFVSEAIEDVSDRIFELFNPTYFSFATTGFSASGGTLGGPVSPNSRPVMEVQAPGGTYLAGITHNIYTGQRWLSNLEEGDIYTHGLPPGQFEMLEAFASLLRGATLAQYEPALALNEVLSLLRTSPMRHDVFIDDFESFGVISGLGYFLHTYMPTTHVNIELGRRRTGTVFRPNRAWNLQFAATGGNYLPVIDVLPAGDMQTPRLMSRNTGYQMQFLNINQNLPFMQQLLREADSGIYAQRGAFDGSYFRPHHVTFGGVVEGLAEQPEYWLRDVPDMFWPDMRGYNLIRTVVEWYYGYNTFFWPNRHGISVMYQDHEILGTAHVVEIPVPDAAIIARVQISETIIHEFFGEIRNADSIAHIDFIPWTRTTWQSDRILPNMRHFERTADVGIEELLIFFNEMLDPHSLVSVPTEADLLNVLDAFSANVLAEYAYQVRLHFMDVPDTVPQRVHDLTHEIIQDASNDFDRVMAIRDYLLQFPYTFDTVPVPRDVCFVDHFLFEGQQGYCVYFASAMAIMARIAGVPSRYVEGFVTPATYAYRELTVITNMMAHAWVEVYLEGFGWLKVEATPTYAYLVQAGFPAPRQTRPGTGEGWEDDEWWRYYEDMEYWLAQQGMAGIPGFSGVGPDPADTQGGIIDELQDRVNPLIIAIAIPAIVFVVLIAYVIMRILQVIGGTKKVRKLDVRDQIIAYFAGIIDVVTHYTVPVGSGETPLGYGKHQGKRFTFRSDSVNLRDLIDLYYKAKYSQHSITEAECVLMKEAYFDMLGKLKWENTKLKYLQLRYIQCVGAIGLAQNPGDKTVTFDRRKVTI